MLKICHKIKKENVAIFLLLSVALILRLAVLIEKGPMYGLGSDDLSYINSGITLTETGSITMHGYLSAQIMPGMPILIALFVLIFGKGYGLWLALKLFWIAMGILSIWGVYKIVKKFSNTFWAILASCFFLAPDFLWMDNIILTETPFMCLFIYLIYFSIQLAYEKKKKYFWFIVASYIACLLIRPTIAPYPLFLFVYLYFKKYDMKLMGRQIVLASLCVSMVIIPWTIRNYVHFNKFIPLTYGMGNPKLLGTYQGYHIPNDDDLDYEEHVINKMRDEIKEYYNFETKEWKDHYMSRYYSLELDGLYANYRLKVWREQSFLGMMASYLILKPYIMIYNSFYWEEVLHISKDWNYCLRILDLCLFFFATLAILSHKKRRTEGIFIISFYIFQIAVYCYSFAFDRYAQTLYFLRFIVIGWGMYLLFSYIKQKYIEKKKISISNF